MNFTFYLYVSIQKYALVEIKKNKRTEEEFKCFNEVLDNLQNGAVKSAVAGKSGVGKSYFIKYQCNSQFEVRRSRFCNLVKFWKYHKTVTCLSTDVYFSVLVI